MCSVLFKQRICLSKTASRKWMKRQTVENSDAAFRFLHGRQKKFYVRDKLKAECFNTDIQLPYPVQIIVVPFDKATNELSLSYYRF